MNKTVFETIDELAVGDIRKQVRGLLGSFLFSNDDIDKKVKVLSGGERGRLALCKLLLQPYNFLVLDEPTNHLDIRSKEVLKKALMDYEGTVILVSHDRDFLDGLSNKLYEFKNGEVKEHLCGISEFMEKVKLSRLEEMNGKNPFIQETEKKKKETPKETVNEEEQAIKAIKSKIQKTEKTIAILEDQIAEIDKKLSDSTFYNSVLQDKTFFENYNRLKADLEIEMKQWEDLNEELTTR